MAFRGIDVELARAAAKFPPELSIHYMVDQKTRTYRRHDLTRSVSWSFAEMERLSEPLWALRRRFLPRPVEE